MKLEAKKIKQIIKCDINSYQELEKYYHNKNDHTTARTMRIKKRAVESLLKYINYLESI